MYVADCRKLARRPAVTFTLGEDGTDLSLSAESLVFQREGSACLLGLQGSSMNQWILGDVFMRQYYVQFDWGQRRIGLAKVAGAGDDGSYDTAAGDDTPDETTGDDDRGTPDETTG